YRSRSPSYHRTSLLFFMLSRPRTSTLFPYTTLFRSHIGYMLMGLGIFTPFALAGSLFYLAHDTIVKPALYLIAGVTEQITGTTRSEEHTSELQSRENLVCRLLLEKKNR